MFTNLHEAVTTRANALPAGEPTGIENFVLTDEFSVIPAYKEMLPDGLISDEV
jgi:hypothetical protein